MVSSIVQAVSSLSLKSEKACVLRRPSHFSPLSSLGIRSIGEYFRQTNRFCQPNDHSALPIACRNSSLLRIKNAEVRRAPRAYDCLRISGGQGMRNRCACSNNTSVHYCSSQWSLSGQSYACSDDGLPPAPTVLLIYPSLICAHFHGKQGFFQCTPRAMCLFFSSSSWHGTMVSVVIEIVRLSRSRSYITNLDRSQLLLTQCLLQ